MVVGITGGIGSGKSLVSKILCEFENTIYYHADEEAKKIINTSVDVREKLIQIFGEEAYNDNRLNNQFISTQVFSDKNKLTKLNSIVHPKVKNHFKNFVHTHKDKIIIYENAILFEVKSDMNCDIIITVTALKEDRISRVMKRDNVKREEVLQIMSNQWNDTKKVLLSNYLIDNHVFESVSKQTEEIYNILTKNKL